MYRVDENGNLIFSGDSDSVITSILNRIDKLEMEIEQLKERTKDGESNTI